MSEHNHREHVEGCFRCDLARDERPTTLAHFLLDRIAEDEAAARYVEDSVSARRRWHHHADGNVDEVTPARWSEPFMPTRVLAECEAKRRIVDISLAFDPHENDDIGLLKSIALPYADHAEYREEWKP